jgi:hypothetical protein
MLEMGSSFARRHGMDRRRFFQTSAGMAASFLAMNSVYGQMFDASVAEAGEPGVAQDRAASLRSQLVFDAHTHFVRDDHSAELADPNRVGGFLWQRTNVARYGWNKDLAETTPTVDDLKFGNFIKEIFLDSDTRIALLTNAPSDDPGNWLLPQAQVFRARDRVNGDAGSRRLLTHFTISPGKPGWLDARVALCASPRRHGAEIERRRAGVAPLPRRQVRPIGRLSDSAESHSKHEAHRQWRKRKNERDHRRPTPLCKPCNDERSANESRRKTPLSDLTTPRDGI